MVTQNSDFIGSIKSEPHFFWGVGFGVVRNYWTKNGCNFLMQTLNQNQSIYVSFCKSRKSSKKKLQDSLEVHWLINSAN